MTTDNVTTEPPVWGAPVPPAPDKPRWSTKKRIATVAIAALIAGGGGAAIYAATATGVTSGGGQFGGPGGGRGFGGPMGGRGGLGAVGNALHGEFTVSDGNGGYTTDLLQNGTVTAVSGTSLTAKSADGYTKTYTINSSTQVDATSSQISSVKTGDTVTVIANADGTATAVDDRSQQSQFGGPGGQFGPGQQGNQQNQQPNQGTQPGGGTQPGNGIQNG